MDKRIKYRIIVDTETCPLDNTLNGVVPSNMFVYDIGWRVVDKYGKTYRTKSYINADIYLNEKELMKSAYYSNKIPQYEQDIKNGTRTLKSFYNIRKDFLDDVAEFNVTEIYAHNMRFDYRVLNNTQRWLTKSRFRYFFPKNLVICDTLKMARDVIGKMPTYKQFCIDNGYLTKNNQLRFTAEILWRYISKDNTFEESHTGLEDTEIEAQILAYCYKQHKKMRRTLWDN